MKKTLLGIGAITLPAALAVVALYSEPWKTTNRPVPALSDAQISTRPVSFPQVVDDQIVGILRTQVSFVFDTATLKKLDRPVSPILTDELMEHTAHSRFVHYSKSEPFDLSGFKSMLKAAVEERFPGDVVKDVAVVKLEFLPAGDLDMLHDQLGKMH